MLEPHQVDQILGQPIYAVGQIELGSVSQVYSDDATGLPAWATVHAGVPGTRTAFIPLADATLNGTRLTVPYNRNTISAAPPVEARGGHLSLSEAAALHRHYGLHGVDNQPEVTPPTNALTDRETAKTATGQTGLTRSEEQLQIATTSRPTETVRLRKYIVTEERTVTVTVQREEVRLEREPIDGGRDSQIGVGPQDVDGSTPEHEMVLYEEQVFIQKRVVPVERVKLVKKTITEMQHVTEQVRKERIETDLPRTTEADDR